MKHVIVVFSILALVLSVQGFGDILGAVSPTRLLGHAAETVGHVAGHAVQTAGQAAEVVGHAANTAADAVVGVAASALSVFDFSHAQTVREPTAFQCVDDVVFHFNFEHPEASHYTSRFYSFAKFALHCHNHCVVNPALETTKCLDSNSLAITNMLERLGQEILAVNGQNGAAWHNYLRSKFIQCYLA